MDCRRAAGSLACAKRCNRQPKGIDMRDYEMPRIEDHGDLTELTAGRNSGAETDAAFPIHTPKDQLTFTTP